jgi:hypothetical protein
MSNYRNEPAAPLSEDIQFPVMNADVRFSTDEDEMMIILPPARLLDNRASPVIIQRRGNQVIFLQSNVVHAVITIPVPAVLDAIFERPQVYIAQLDSADSSIHILPHVLFEAI